MLFLIISLLSSLYLSFLSVYVWFSPLFSFFFLLVVLFLFFSTTLFPDSLSHFSRFSFLLWKSYYFKCHSISFFVYFSYSLSNVFPHFSPSLFHPLSYYLFYLLSLLYLRSVLFFLPFSGTLSALSLWNLISGTLNLCPAIPLYRVSMATFIALFLLPLPD